MSKIVYYLACGHRTKSVRSPFEVLRGRKPDISYLHVWGSKAIVNVPEKTRNKLDKSGLTGIFVGYAINSKGYRIAVPNGADDVRIYESRDVIFHEKDYSGATYNT